jgi:hypothetical protein
MHDLRLLAEDKTDCAVQADGGQRLISYVEQQYPAQCHLPGWAARWLPGHP